jgi:TolB protein
MKKLLLLIVIVLLITGCALFEPHNEDPLYPSEADVSNDGTKIVFDSDGNIYCINADGSGLENLTADLTSNNMSAKWSADDTSIVFVRETGGDEGIYTVDANGAHVTEVIDLAGINEQDPSWSPDGTRITYNTHGDTIEGLYIVDVDGSNNVYLTSMGSGGTSWAPDGNSIAYAGNGISVVIISPTVVTSITDYDSSEGHDYGPGWSPTESDILLFGRRGNDYSNIYFADLADNNALTAVTSTTDDHYVNPSWFPDGNRIIFNSLGADSMDKLYTIHKDGTELNVIEIEN